MASDDTQLLFCTTGILLRRLQNDPLLGGVSHVIMDEVHERSIDSDFLLIILRDLIRSHRPDLRVVLMSATLNADTFASFFQTPGIVPPPNLHIPGFTFPVEDFFFEDAVENTQIAHADVVGSRFKKRQRHHGNGNRSGGGGGGGVGYGNGSDSGIGSSKYRDTVARLSEGGYSKSTAETTALFDESEIPFGLIAALVDKIRK